MFGEGSGRGRGDGDGGTFCVGSKVGGEVRVDRSRGKAEVRMRFEEGGSVPQPRPGVRLRD